MENGSFSMLIFRHCTLEPAARQGRLLWDWYHAGKNWLAGVESGRGPGGDSRNRSRRRQSAL